MLAFLVIDFFVLILGFILGLIYVSRNVSYKTERTLTLSNGQQIKIKVVGTNRKGFEWDVKEL